MPIFLFLLLLITPAFAGDLSARFDLALNRILDGGPPRLDDKFVLADLGPQPGRRFTNFSGDVSGRYIGALSLAARHTRKRYPSLDRIVSATLALQQPDGHFGAPLSEGKVIDSDMATLWGNARMLIGLLEYYDLTKRPEVLASARKLGDFLVKIGPRFNADEVNKTYSGEKFAVGYICWTNNLEGIVELYRVTKDERYLVLAREIAARTKRHPAQHSHGFLATVRGIVDLYKVTGEPRYLEQAKAEWKGVVASGNVLLHGAVPEMFAPQIKRDEGCSEADWLRLTLDLWQITREPEYLRQAQLTLFNEFVFNQFHTGDFGHHALSGNGITTSFARAWWCCTFHGLRALASTFSYAFHSQSGALLYDIPVDGRGDSAGFAVRADSSLERNATVRFTVLKADGKAHSLSVRVPDWASEVKLSLASESRDGYVSASRIWKAGEVVTATYKLSTRVVRRDEKSRKSVAIFHGPWLLAVDQAASPNYFDEPSPQNAVQLLDAAGEVRLEPAVSASAATQRFTIPVAHFKLKYLPGGYSMQPQTALLRPMAEFTAEPDSNLLEFWLPVVSEVERLDSNYTTPVKR